VKYKFDYSLEKDLILKESRGVSFREVIQAYRTGKKLADYENKSKKHPNQRLLIVNIKGYAYVTPYVIDEKRKRVFLKTVYPSSKLTKEYIKKL